MTSDLRKLGLKHGALVLLIYKRAGAIMGKARYGVFVGKEKDSRKRKGTSAQRRLVFATGTVKFKGKYEPTYVMVGMRIIRDVKRIDPINMLGHLNKRHERIYARCQSKLATIENGFESGRVPKFVGPGWITYVRFGTKSDTNEPVMLTASRTIPVPWYRIIYHLNELHDRTWYRERRALRALHKKEKEMEPLLESEDISLIEDMYGTCAADAARTATEAERARREAVGAADESEQALAAAD